MSATGTPSHTRSSSWRGSRAKPITAVYRILTALLPFMRRPGPRRAPMSSASQDPAPSSGTPADDIETLIHRCLNGDQAAWDLIVRQHWRKVFNVAYKFVGKHDEAEDLTQDIFLKVFKSLDTFDRRANFQTWLISVSRNLCIDHYRSVRKERETIDRDVDASELTPISKEVGAIALLE